MTGSYYVALTSAAKAAGVPHEELRRAVLAAVANYRCEEIIFKAITIRGKQFALATRVVVEVDYFPNRVPNVTLLESDTRSTVKHTR